MSRPTGSETRQKTLRAVSLMILEEPYTDLKPCHSCSPTCTWFCWFKELLGYTPICSPEDPEMVSVPLSHGPRQFSCTRTRQETPMSEPQRSGKGPLFGSKQPFKHSHGQSSIPRDLVGDTPIQKQA